MLSLSAVVEQLSEQKNLMTARILQLSSTLASVEFALPTEATTGKIGGLRNDTATSARIREKARYLV